ncbi:hypothetical protein F8M41_008603 [Gigaspora margarita]|uniref:Uncharacterized protein n=1 Tax=Gigaspora margarita TaxID=4874 RepID=A0A8H3X4U5_GIGMA|nr:hypothetical protein F8M41_008603 [Gigaspora margarita]
MFLIVKPIEEFYYNYYARQHSSIILAIPLPNFTSYPKNNLILKELLLPSYNSFTYSNMFEMVTEEFYRYLNGEALLKFKWNTYEKNII